MTLLDLGNFGSVVMQTIFRNGHIFGGSPEIAQGSLADDVCMIVQDDCVEYVGSAQNERVSQAEENGARVIDLQGQTVLPGFIDGHMHLLLFGSSLTKIDLEECQNLNDIRATIREGSLRRPDAKRLFCRGWMHFMTNSEARADMLDGIDDQDRPIFVDAKDLHSAWCNTAALRELNVQDMPDPAGGTIHRDEHGNPSGLLSEAAAITLVWPHIANVATVEEKLSYVREAVKIYNMAGYTGMVEMAMDENAWTTLVTLRQQERVPIRLAAHWIIKPSETEEENFAQVDRAIELHRQYNSSTSPDFRIAGIKVICDGVVDACTAALTEPYSSNGVSCDPLWREDMLKKVVQRADAAGLQCALHAIGDAAVKLAVDVLEAAGTPGRRHRIEHLELTSPSDAARLGRLGITASIQPVHADPALFKAWPQLLGSERITRAFAYRDFHDHGANLAIGTDSPTAPHLPFPNLYIATTRRSARAPHTTDTVNPQFALTFHQAIDAATRGAAFSCFADHLVGTLSPGKKADFIVVDMPSCSSPRREHDLLNLTVRETWFNGQCVYKK